MNTTDCTQEIKELRLEIETEMNKINRINMIRNVWRILKLVVAAFIGLIWDLKYADYTMSNFFEEDIKTFFLGYCTDGLAYVMAEIFYWVIPLFCVVCFFYPFHCYMKGVGWYQHPYRRKE